MYPNADPIPLPAPVWLMKVLSLLTLALHFTALMLLVGGLFMVLLLAAGKTEAAKKAALAVAKKLPTTMTYVINLGVPPLLFAQVLYGRALYTSSVLMAAIWIAVIPLVMGCYWHLYRTADRLANGKSPIITTLVALVLAMCVGQIYSLNMTLMLRPEVWQGMYAKTATGLQVAPHDPTMFPRFAFMMLGGLAFGGVGALVVALQRGLDDDTRALLRQKGGLVASAALVPQVLAGFWVYSRQPEGVQQALHSPLYLTGAGLFLLGGVLALLLAALHIGGKKPLLLTIGAAVGGFLANVGAVIYRDGIRDQTLRLKGFDVWDRAVVPNWGVIGIFLVLFVIGLGLVGWLVLVAAQAKTIETKEAEVVA
ncbi:hypothetical protein [Armatimonas rosea]|uniref:Uncharacterized protein n=1 Tax=Armatimonas rosea TaxID=685828 RepID=A0A7W9W5Q9_ARMRO|nr:hypothetical protein [Armatimonas rosea]MBB6049833.1 hypothetical protein [Armatimonas rosea]